MPPSTPDNSLGELEQMAMMGELARPLVHECNNFLNNWLLQVALFQAELPDNLRVRCETLRRESWMLAELLRQWQRFRNAAEQAEKADLNMQLQEAIRGPDDMSVNLTRAECI